MGKMEEVKVLVHLDTMVDNPQAEILTLRVCCAIDCVQDDCEKVRFRP